jgi:hypothetical protein
VIPADILEKLTTSLARWDGRGPSDDDTLHAGQEMASAVMALLVWDSQQ